jgi:transcription elongation factor Elf1
MIKQAIKTLQDATNSVTCNFCGKKHTVRFDVDERTSPVQVHYRFSDDTCDEFKTAVLNSVTQVMIRHCVDYVYMYMEF